MDKKTIKLLESIGNLELDEGEAEKIEEALGEKMLLELKESLESFDETTLEGVVEIGVSKLTQIIVTLSTRKREEEEEEEVDSEGEKVKKSKPWSFTFEPESED
ncbi:hypothetical protein ES702_06156 [subsurface metagenome]